MDRTSGRGPERMRVQAEYRDFTVCLDSDRFPLIVFETCGWVLTHPPITDGVES